MLHSVALTKTAGNVVGVLIGCFLGETSDQWVVSLINLVITGMFPLMWPEDYRLWRSPEHDHAPPNKDEED